MKAGPRLGRAGLVFLLLLGACVPLVEAAEDTARAPGVYRMGPGSALRIPVLSERGEVGLLVEQPGFRVVVRSPHQAEPLVVVEGPSGEVVLHGRDVPQGGPVVITVEQAPPGTSALLRWDDPDWFLPAPTVGHIAAVVALAAFVTLHHGGVPRRYG